jgi:hypothetical protein
VTRRTLTFALLAAATACARDIHRIAPVHVSGLGFDMPGDWNEHLMTQQGVVTATWSPDDNDRKESMTVIRTKRSPLVAADGGDALAKLLARAEHTDSSKVSAVATPTGFKGVRVDVDFNPPGNLSSYHRVHAVLLDGTDLVHVLYTAQRPDRALSVFNGVLSSIHHEESRP